MQKYKTEVSKDQRYKIEVSKDQRDAILAAVESHFTRTVNSKISFGSHKGSEVWIEDNKQELDQLREATLLSSTLGNSWSWLLVVEEATSEEEED